MSVKWGEHSRFSNGRRFLVRLFDAQDGLCASCGYRMDLATRTVLLDLPPEHPLMQLESYLLMASIDHLEPRSRGGTDCPRNKVAMHIRCNSDKGNRPPTGCERIFHMLVLERLHLPERSDFEPHINQHNPPPGTRPTLGDLWPRQA